MTTRAKHRPALIEAAARLFRRQGYAATGTNEILAESGAPRGSLYYYFPEGKEEIGAAALEAAGKTVTRTLTALAADTSSPADFVRAYLELLAGWLEQSGYRDGCPISTTLLETAPASQKIAAAGQSAFQHWQAAIEEVLTRHGWPEARRAGTANLILSVIEGALILARAAQSPEPLNAAAEELALILEH